MAEHEKPDLPAHRNLFRMILAPSIWAIHFLLAYCTAAIWCAKGLGDPDTLTLIVTGYTAAAEVVIVILGLKMWTQWDYLDDYDYVHSESTDEHRREFLGHAGFMLACLSFVAVIFNTMPAWFAGTCL
ncbi:hypothetical protein [Palleronia sp.]|uniref:hypothetical protein n=1 Tax=Palleronia sp. TaxID=1940284 RepID=UPI0035C790DD